MLFNINESVKVKLNDHGREILQRQHENLYRSIPGKRRAYTPRSTDADGWSTWQLWDLMNTFGPYVGLGMSVPFDTEIEIPDKKGAANE